jgi:arylsulfatase A-like enzyme
MELSETLHELESLLDEHPDPGRPIFFYAQPKNVHLWAHNHLPVLNSSNWVRRPDFSNRVAYELHQVDSFMGEFFAYLKSHGLYDNSIIVFASDHGEALGDFGRESHSSIIFPEIMRVPLIIHLPERMRNQFVFDNSNSLAALTDIAPTIYYLLGHRPLTANPLFGHSLFAKNMEEFHDQRRSELFMASDSRAAYGLLSDNGKFLYTTYDSPTQSFLFNLQQDPNATNNVLTDSARSQYQERVLDYLQEIARFYQYKPTGGVVAAKKDTFRLQAQ